jgi:uncharacterized protein
MHPTSNKRKLINDPLHGFITIPEDLIFELIEHPWFQRLRRIQQLGMTSLVYPGAQHTRFHHALGAMHLMEQAIEVLRGKGIPITHEESRATLIAILLHDIGHGPYSHALESCIINNIHHESISLSMLHVLNKQFGNKLSMAIEIFTNNYEKGFLHQLISSQLDMDRLDYLMRDSFYSGVSEGVVNTDRILKMLTVVNGNLAIEAKGIYSIEKFIVARRLMYWQVYFHKTVLASESLLINILRRARELSKTEKIFASPAFEFFLTNEISEKELENDPKILAQFAKLDDYDILSAIKVWCDNEDKVLSILSNSLINRNLFRLEFSETAFDDQLVDSIKNAIMARMDIKEEDSNYLLMKGVITNNAYNPQADRILIAEKDGKVNDFSELTNMLNIGVYSSVVQKFYLCFPKDVSIKV